MRSQLILQGFWFLRSVRAVSLICLACVWVTCSPNQVNGQAHPSPDHVRQLSDRLDALERENAATRAENARLQSFIRGRFPDFASGTVPEAGGSSGALDVTPSTASADSGSLAGDFIERLGTHYDNGFVLVESPDSKRVPFQLKFNLFNQFRYLNQQLDSNTFVDHLGNVHPVDSRNDINANRNLFYFTGYVFDPDFVYNIIIWSSNSVATVVQGGSIGYHFNKAFSLYGGYGAIPGTRTNTNDFMFLTGVERSMADSFFRPGFTQGIWADGKLFDQLSYLAYVGNSMNTLNVGTSKIDRNMIYGCSMWWEPLGDYGPPGWARMAYSDFEFHESSVVRLGTSIYGSREDRFSNGANSSNPENTALYNSDGVLVFATGAFAPGVTVDYVNAYGWAQDFGYKYRGLAFNGQYFFRLLNSFKADGPLPLTSTFDHGFEASLGYFAIPKKLEVYGRSSAVFGEFRDSNEYAVGLNWHPFENRGFRIIAEANHVQNSPTSSIQTIYNAGMAGWNFVLQTQMFF